MHLLHTLPYKISYFLGYRKPNHVAKDIPQWRIYFWSFLGSWIGIAVLQIIFTYSPSFEAHHTPSIIASFGAAAVLLQGVMESPLATPRNVICGQFIGSLVGVCVAQLFLGIRHIWESETQRMIVQWVGGATAMALSLTIMQLTRTVHPPAGASALIAVVTPDVTDLSWFYIGVTVLSAVVQVAIACLINNIERRYPQYWWTPHEKLHIDSATIATVMPLPDSGIYKEEENVDAYNLSAIELGVRHQGSSSSSVSDMKCCSISNNTITDSKNIIEAIKTLRTHINDSNIKYILISPGLPLIYTAGLLSEPNQEVLANLLLDVTEANSSSNTISMALVNSPS